MNVINPKAVFTIFELMPVVVLIFGVDGKVTYANRRAMSHPGKPAESFSNQKVIKSLARDLTLGKVKFPFVTEVELAEGLKIKGVFTAGLSGLDVTFVELMANITTPAPPKASLLGEVIALMKDELGRPLRDVSIALDHFPESPKASALQEATDALNLRMNRVMDLITVFGDELLVTNDRIDLPELVATTCAELAPQAKDRRVRFVVTPPVEQLPPIYGNEKIIRRAFTECFENAIRHSRWEVNSNHVAGIQVGFTLTGHHVLISIVNSGALPVDSKHKETHSTFSSDPTTPSIGRLGLPLVERIVGLHGGNMRVRGVGDDEVRVLLEFPTGAPSRGQAQLDMAQAQRYAADLAELMSRRKKEIS